MKNVDNSRPYFVKLRMFERDLALYLVERGRDAEQAINKELAGTWDSQMLQDAGYETNSCSDYTLLHLALPGLPERILA